MPPRLAILDVVNDYLTVMSTWQGIKPGYDGYFGGLLAGLPVESLPAVAEPEVEEDGFSLDNICGYWTEGYKSGATSGLKEGEEWFLPA